MTVIGLDGGRLSAPALAALAEASHVAGSSAALAAVELPAACVRFPLAPFGQALDRLRAGRSPVVLASGDPGFFGVVRALGRHGFAPRVLPGVSSLAAAFGRVGLSWDGAVVVSAHGRDLTGAVNACRALPQVGVLTGPGAGAAEFGAALTGWNRILVVAERVGYPDERVTTLIPEQAAQLRWADPHVLLSLRPDAAPGLVPEADASDDGPRADNQPAAPPSGGWALPENAYLHRDSMITKAEVRALVVARLRPRLGRLIWDVGAGSGSVGLECAALGAAVVALDADPDACDQVRTNARRQGVDVFVVAGAAPEALASLPDPDAVFVGGGGLGALAAAAARRPPRVVATLAALDRVGPAVELLRRSGYVVDGVQLAASRLADLPGGSLRLAAVNPIIVLTGELS